MDERGRRVKGRESASTYFILCCVQTIWTCCLKVQPQMTLWVGGANVSLCTELTPPLQNDLGSTVSFVNQNPPV